jgi:hypothetical protein
MTQVLEFRRGTKPPGPPRWAAIIFVVLNLPLLPCPGLEFAFGRSPWSVVANFELDHGGWLLLLLALSFFLAWPIMVWKPPTSCVPYRHSQKQISDRSGRGGRRSPTPRAERLRLDATQEASVVSRYAGDTSTRLMDAPNKVQLDPGEPSSHIIGTPAFYALCCCVKWPNRTRMKHERFDSHHRGLRCGSSLGHPHASFPAAASACARAWGLATSRTDSD